MELGGLVRPKLGCGLATNRSATRLPTSCGEEPLGQESNPVVRFGSAAIALQHIAAASIVAQICNLLYRRVALGCARKFSEAVRICDDSQNAILRYSRLQLCATNRAGPE